MAARLALHEPRLFVALFRWAFRRVRLESGEFGYYKRSLLRAVVPMIMVVSPIELLVVHLLAQAFSPWSWLKWALLVLGTYAIFWLLGLYASLVTLPHRLEESGLRLRHGIFAEGFIPYKEIQATTRRYRKAPNSRDGLRRVPEEDAIYLATGGKTNVTLRLKAPRSVTGFLKESAAARLVHLAADEPERLARELRRRVELAAADIATAEHLPAVPEEPPAR